MKTVAIILSVLIAVNVVHGISEEARIYREHYKSCARQLSVPIDEFRVDTVICAAVQDGEILDSSGAYDAESCIKKIRLFTSDPDRLEKAYEVYFRCDKEAVESGAVGIGKTLRFLMCGLDLITFFDRE